LTVGLAVRRAELEAVTFAEFLVKEPFERFRYLRRAAFGAGSCWGAAPVTRMETTAGATRSIISEKLPGRLRVPFAAGTAAATDDAARFLLDSTPPAAPRATIAPSAATAVTELPIFFFDISFLHIQVLPSQLNMEGPALRSPVRQIKDS